MPNQAGLIDVVDPLPLDEARVAAVHEPRYLEFLSTAWEQWTAAGYSHDANYPMAPGTTFAEWAGALADACKRITDFAPDALVVSLGVDTFEADPISSFKLTSDDFSTYGRTLGALKLPTVYLMEGGYAVEQIGTNTVNVLLGHLQKQ